jgi:hypothetical protein
MLAGLSQRMKKMGSRGDHMGWRFRRSIKICKGIQLNFNKTGLGLSVGVKGFHVGTGPRGRYVSAGLPGTGLYAINYMGKQKKGPRSVAATTPQQVPRVSSHDFNSTLTPGT